MKMLVARDIILLRKFDFFWHYKTTFFLILANNYLFFQISVDSIDDKEDMQFADEAFDILGFTKEEKYNVYKVTSVVMHLGEMKFKKKSAKDDQAAADGTEAGKKIATLLGKIIPFPWDMQF